MTHAPYDLPADVLELTRKNAEAHYSAYAPGLRDMLSGMPAPARTPEGTAAALSELLSALQQVGKYAVTDGTRHLIYFGSGLLSAAALLETFETLEPEPQLRAVLLITYHVKLREGLSKHLPPERVSDLLDSERIPEPEELRELLQSFQDMENLGLFLSTHAVFSLATECLAEVESEPRRKLWEGVEAFRDVQLVEVSGGTVQA